MQRLAFHIPFWEMLIFADEIFLLVENEGPRRCSVFAVCLRLILDAADDYRYVRRPDSGP